MKRFERSNGLDTTLYKNYLFFLSSIGVFHNDLRPSCSVVLSDDLDLQRLWNLLTKPSSTGFYPLKIVRKQRARKTISQLPFRSP